MDGLVHGGVGVLAGAELRADGLEETDDGEVIVVLGGAEGEMLDEMRDATLVELLGDRADVDCERERGAILGLERALDEVALSVGAGADAMALDGARARLFPFLFQRERLERFPPARSKGAACREEKVGERARAPVNAASRR